MIEVFEGIAPTIAESAYIADTAVVIGDVTIGDQSSIWFQSVVRGDMNHIRIGDRTNIQDLCMVHVQYRGHPAIVGDDVTVGHHVVLHACTIGNRVLVGIGSIILDGAQIGEESIIGAGALVTPGTIIPPRSFVLGAPARVRRAVTNEEVARVGEGAARYLEYTRKYKEMERHRRQ